VGEPPHSSPNSITEEMLGGLVNPAILLPTLSLNNRRDVGWVRQLKFPIIRPLFLAQNNNKTQFYGNLSNFRSRDIFYSDDAEIKSPLI